MRALDDETANGNIRAVFRIGIPELMGLPQGVTAMFLLTTNASGHETKAVYRSREDAITAGVSFVGEDCMGYGKPSVNNGTKVWASSRLSGFGRRSATVEPVTFVD